jgi:hypothetical protein
MEGALSKARRIYELLQSGKKPKEIAAIVGCSDAYVRVIRQRQAGGGKSKADLAWEATNPETVRAIKRRATARSYAANPEKRRDYMRRWMAAVRDKMRQSRG